MNDRSYYPRHPISFRSILKFCQAKIKNNFLPVIKLFFEHICPDNKSRNGQNCTPEMLGNMHKQCALHSIPEKQGP